MTALENPKVTSIYGNRVLKGIREHHNGLDEVDAKGNRNVRSIWDTIKTEVLHGYNSGRGNLVRLYYSDTLRAIDQHLDKIYIKSGQRVKQGDIIGLYGSSGYSFGAHLHEEIQVLRNGVWVAVHPSQYTEVPNRIGIHPGNNKLDNQAAGTPGIPAPAGNLYMLTIGPASGGDRDFLTALARKLMLPVKHTGGSKGNTTLTIGPASKGDMLTFQNEATRLKLPFTAKVTK